MKAPTYFLGLAFALILAGCASAPKIPQETRIIQLHVRPVDADIRVTEGSGRFLFSGRTLGGALSFMLIGPHQLVTEGTITVRATAADYPIEIASVDLSEPGPYKIDLGETFTERRIKGEAEGRRIAAAEEAERVARVKSHTSTQGDFELYWDYEYSDHESAYQRFAGTVKNVGTHSCARLPIRLDVWDENGAAIINSDWTFAVDSLPLRPGETRRWEMMIKKPTPRVSVTIGKPMDRN